MSKHDAPQSCCPEWQSRVSGSPIVQGEWGTLNYPMDLRRTGRVRSEQQRQDGRFGCLCQSWRLRPLEQAGPVPEGWFGLCLPAEDDQCARRGAYGTGGA